MVGGRLRRCKESRFWWEGTCLENVGTSHAQKKRERERDPFQLQVGELGGGVGEGGEGRQGEWGP